MDCAYRLLWILYVRNMEDKTMAIIDEKGRLFGKWNIIDILAVIFISLLIIPSAYFGYKIFIKPPPQQITQRAWYYEKIDTLDAEIDALKEEITNYKTEIAVKQAKQEAEQAKQEAVFKQHPRLRKYFK